MQVFYFVIFGLNQDFFPIIEFKEPLNLAKYISLFFLLFIKKKIINFNNAEANFGNILTKAFIVPKCFL